MAVRPGSPQLRRNARGQLRAIRKPGGRASGASASRRRRLPQAQHGAGNGRAGTIRGGVYAGQSVETRLRLFRLQGRFHETSADFRGHCARRHRLRARIARAGREAAHRRAARPGARRARVEGREARAGQGRLRLHRGHRLGRERALPPLQRHPGERDPIWLAPALDALVSKDAKLELVKGGFGFTEGIVWVEKGRYLLFSDIPANVIYKLTPKGAASIYLQRSGYTKPDIWRVGFEQTNGKDPADPLFEKFYMIGSNGLALDRQGRLVIATWAGRSIDRIEKDGKRTVLANQYEGRQFNGPNDVIVKKNGTIYFTDTFGGLRQREKDPRKGLEYQGIYMIKDGRTRLVISDIPNPNGLALSPDEKYL